VDVVDDVLHFRHDISSCIDQLRQVNALTARAWTTTIEDERLRPYFERMRSSEPLWRILISNKMPHSGYDTVTESLGDGFRELMSLSETQQPATSIDIRVENPYHTAMEEHLPGRAFFTTKNGFVGVGMPETRIGDEVTIWFGSPVPFVVRASHPGEGTYCVVGTTYVGGVMKGELVDELYCEDLMDSVTLFVR